MNYRRTVAALCAATMLVWATAASAPAAPGPSAAANPVVPAQVRTLANGLRVVVLVDRAAPVAEVSTWYRFGAAYETPGKTGLAHALEHMMFRGTPSLSSAGLDDWGARLGAVVNAQTTNEFTHYFFLLPSDRVEDALRVEADRMHDLKLAKADWDKERGAVLQEWAQDYSNPLFGFVFGINRKVWPDSPLGKTALGERADIEKATVDDLRAYYQRWYAPNNATVVVTGDVDPATVFAQVSRWFGPVPRRALPPRPAAPAVAARDQRVEQKAEFPFTVVDLAYGGAGDAPPTETAALDQILAVYAMQNPRGPLRKALVDSGLTLGTFFSPISERRVTTVHALAIVAPGHTADEVRTAFRTTLDGMLKAGFDQEFVDAAKRQFVSSLTYSRDSITGLAGGIGAGYVFPGDSDPTTYARQIDAVTKAQVDEAARTLFATPSVVGVLEPTTTDPTKAKPPSELSGGVSDKFGDRVPDGPVVQPAWMKASIARALDLHSRVRPVVSTLPNGLRLLVQRVPTNPTVFVNGFVRVAPQFDPPDKTGLGAIAGALLNFGSAKYDYDAQHKVADDLGASIAYGTTFSAHGFASDLPALLDPLADSLQHPTFPEDRFTLIKTQNVATLTRRTLQPDYRSSRAFLEALYPAGDPALREATPETVGAITRDDVKTWAQTYLRPDLTTLVIVGDVDPPAARAAVERAFGAWTASGPKPDPHVAPIPLPSPVRKIVETPAQDVGVQLGAPAIAITDPDWDALRVANAIYGGGAFESRLFREVREKRGLVYFASSSVTGGRDRGTFSVNFRAVPAKVDAADALVRAELVRMQQQPPAPDELTRAKTRLVGSAVIAEQSTAAIAGDLIGIGSNDLPADYYATLPARIGRIGAADVLRAAKAHFYPDHLVEVRTGPAAAPAAGAGTTAR